ncbi:MAG: osmotically inducible protein C [Bacteroidia bacterium]|nr:MAG: osmotically inducible protein C [Bacteroidia bacterium]
MGKHEINLEWEKAMKFHSKVNGHDVYVDADVSIGGTDAAPRPKPLMLVALAGCTAMDVVSLLNKMKVPFSYFNVKIEAELSEEHPKIYTKTHMVYQIKGENIDKAKVEKAVNLSQEKYCGVSAMFKKFSELTFEIQYL